MARGTGYQLLQSHAAVWDAALPHSRGEDQYCLPIPTAPAGGRGDVGVYPRRHLAPALVSLCFALCALPLLPPGVALTEAIVDLERGLPEAPSRTHRPRVAHLYQYDKTEVDLAVPTHNL